VTLLVALRSPEAIVFAHDLKTRGDHKYEWSYFKSRLLGFGTMAMFTTDHVSSAAGMIQRVWLNSDKQLKEHCNPWHYADVLAATTRKTLRRAYGKDWASDDRAPRATFVVGGWLLNEGAPPSPQVIRLPWENNYIPELHSDTTPLTEGDYGIAEHFVLNHVFPPGKYPFMTIEQMVVLSYFLIQEASQSVDGVGHTPWVQVLRPDDVAPSLLTKEQNAVASHRAHCIEVSITNAIHGALGIPPVPDPKCIPPAEDA
jgi:hypothetical protein